MKSVPIGLSWCVKTCLSESTIALTSPDGFLRSQTFLVIRIWSWECNGVSLRLGKTWHWSFLNHLCRICKSAAAVLAPFPKWLKVFLSTAGRYQFCIDCTPINFVLIWMCLAWIYAGWCSIWKCRSAPTLKVCPVFRDQRIAIALWWDLRCASHRWG